MSVQALSWAMGQQVGDTGAKLVLCALANYADDNGVAWPNVKTLMRAAECSRATLFRKLDHLEELGLLEREQRHDDVGYGSDTNPWVWVVKFRRREPGIGP